MKVVSLKQYCSENSQPKAARLLGCSQSAVHQMIKTNREIFIFQDGVFESHLEIKRPTKLDAEGFRIQNRGLAKLAGYGFTVDKLENSLALEIAKK